MAALAQDVLRRLRGVLFVLGAVAILYYLQDIAQLLVLAALIAYLLNPFVSRLEVHMRRSMATLVVFGVLVAGLVLVGSLMGPVVEHQVQDVRSRVDAGGITSVVQQVDARLTRISESVGGGPVRFEEQLRERWRAWTQGLLGFAPNLLEIVTNVLLVPFVALFLVLDGPRIKRALIKFVPNRYFEFSLEALHNIDVQLGNYLRGLVVEIGIITVLSAGALWLLNVPAYIFIALLAGVTTVIPYAGSLIGGIVGVFVQLASTGSASAAALVFLVFLAIQIADEVFIEPLLFAQALDLHPLEVLLSVWIAAHLFGVVGMILAIPVAGVGKVVFSETAALIQQYQFSKAG